MIEIKKGVPMPFSPSIVYPWPELEIGDCFDVPVPDHRTARDVQNSVHVAARHFRNRHKVPLKLITRTIDGAIRVWRVE